MYPIVMGMLDEMCELAKQDMKEMGRDELGSWTRAVTSADGTWQTMVGIVKMPRPVFAIT